MTADRLQTICFKIIDWSFVAGLFLVPVYFAWFHENYTVFDINKSVALRLFISIFFIGLLVYVASSGRLPYQKSKKLILAWCALFCLMIVSTVFSLHPTISLWGSYERQQGLHNLLSYLLFFLSLIIFVRSRRQFIQLLVTAHISAALISAYGLLQAFGFDFLRWAESSVTRIFSSFGQPNFFGHYLAVMIPLTIYSALFVSKKLSVRLFFVAVGVAEALCLIFTYSRSAWLALFVAGALSLVFALWHCHWKKTSIAVSVLAVVIFILMTLSPIRSFVIKHTAFGNFNIITRAVSALDINGGSAATRFKYWQATLTALSEAPLGRQLFGFGPDVQASVFVRQYKIDWGYSERINSFPDRAHNAPLDILLQFGFLGALAFLSLIIFSIMPLWRRLRRETGEEYWLCLALGASLIAYGVNNLFSFSLTAMSVMFFWLLASAYLVGENFPGFKERTISFFQPASRWIIAVGLIILMAIMFWGYSIRPFVADYYYMQVKKAEARQNCRATLDNMEKVMTWYPISHYYSRAYLHHSVNCFSAVNSTESRQQLVANIVDQVAVLPERENQFYTLTDLAHAYSILGYYGDEKYYIVAERYYHDLLKINPVITVTYQDYGRMRLWQGRFSEAREIFNQGLSVTPSFERAPESSHISAILRQTAYFHDLIGLSYANEKDIDKAISEYKKAIAIDPTMTSPYKELADIAYQKNNIDEAISYNKQGFLFEPDNSLWPIGLATLYLEKKDFANAVYYAKLGAQLDPTNEKIKDLLRELKIE